MNFLLLLVLLLSSSYASSIKNVRGLRSDDVRFEDALLERLRDLREEESIDNYIYDDEEEDDIPKYNENQLLHVLKELKRESDSVHRPKSVKRSKDEKKVLYHKKRDSEKVLDKVKIPPIKKDAGNLKDGRTANRNKVINIEKNSKREAAADVNNQVANVVPDDDNFDKENKVDSEINLRDVLDPPVTNPPNTTQKKPTHSHIKKTRVTSSKSKNLGLDRVSFIAVVAGCVVASIAGIALAAYCWYKLRADNKGDEKFSNEKGEKKKKVEKKKSQHKEKPTSDDEKLAKNAEMYHYQHAKNQIQQLGQNGGKGDKYQTADTTDDEEDEDTVYECPGLAPRGDMRVVNPLFSDAESPHHSDRQSETTSHGGATPPNERVDLISKTSDSTHTP